jgi:uncharacterized protein DUF4038/collagenase-like protein with putative collagen-binding domain
MKAIWAAGPVLALPLVAALLLFAQAPASPGMPHAPQAVPSSPARFPISVSADKRYLVDRTGQPYPIRGDAAWSLIANLTREEADAYLSDRQAKGFTALLVNLLEHRFAVRAPANRRGDQPFTKPGDFTTPNPAYFAHADDIIDLAASKGFVVFLDVMYLGADGGPEGFWNELTSTRNTRDVCFNYGRFIGERFRSKTNVVFVMGGDFTPPAGSEGESRLRRIVEGVKAAGATQLWTGHWGQGLSTDVSATAHLIDLQGAYPSKEIVTADCARGFRRQPHSPTFLLEAGYEAEEWKPGDAASIRAYEWSALLSGCTAGVFYGHRDIWEFATDSWSSGYKFGSQRWQRSLNSPGAVAMAHMGELLDSLPWYAMIPSRQSEATGVRKVVESSSWYGIDAHGALGERTFVVSGVRNYKSGSRVVAAVTKDGKYLLAYRPHAHRGAFTIDMTVMSAPATARWWDPTNGVFMEAGTRLPNAGTRDFTPPAANAGHKQDWVLVLSS